MEKRGRKDREIELVNPTMVKRIMEGIFNNNKYYIVRHIFKIVI